MFLVTALLGLGAFHQAMAGDPIPAPLPTPVALRKNARSPKKKILPVRAGAPAKPASSATPTLSSDSAPTVMTEAEANSRKNSIAVSSAGLAFVYPYVLGGLRESLSSQLGFEAHALLLVPSVLGNSWRARLTLGLQNYGIPTLTQVAISQWLIFVGAESRIFKARNKFQPFAAGEVGTIFSHLSYDKSLGNALSNTGVNYGVRIRAGSYYDLPRHFKLSLCVPISYTLGAKALLTTGLVAGVKYDL